MNAYTGPERRDEDPLARIVTTAVRTALDARHRGQLREVALVSLCVGLLIVLPLAAWIVSSGRAAAHTNSIYNCRLIGRLADIQGRFISSDAIDRQGALTRAEKAQVLAGFGKLFTPRFIRHATAEQQTLDKYTIAYWQGPRETRGPFAGLEPLLAQTRNLEKVNCQTTLR